MNFDLVTGKEDFEDGRQGIWRADDWIHFDCAGGFSSVLMKKKTLRKFITFLREVHLFPGGHEMQTKRLRFSSDSHDEGGSNVLICGKAFVVVWRIEFSIIDKLCDYLEQNIEGDGLTEEQRNKRDSNLSTVNPA